MFYHTPAVIVSDPVWSNVIGQWIVAHHAIPTHDHWAWTAVGQAWMPQEWLFEVTLYVINHVLGFRGVVVMMALVSVLTWTVLADLLRRQGIAHPLGWALLAAMLSTPWDQVRAETFSYLFFVLTLWLVEIAKEKPVMLWWLLPLEVMWANTHGSFMLGIAVALWLGIVLYIPTFDGEWIHHSSNRALGKTRLYAAGGMILASFLNPQGPHLYVFAYWLSFASHVSQYILEWQPAVITEWFTLGLMIELAVFLFLRLQRKEAVQLDTLFWVLGTFYMFMKSVRFGSYAVLTIPWALAPTMALTLPKRWADSLKTMRHFSTALIIGLTVGCSLLAVEVIAVTHGTLYQNVIPITETQAVHVVQRIETLHPHWRVWNGYNLGDELEAAGIPVSVDGRTEVYLANGLMKKYVDTIAAHPDTLSILHKEQVRVVAIASKTSLTTLLAVTPGWINVYHNKKYTIFERRVLV
jgi:hypothetical protein